MNQFAKVAVAVFAFGLGGVATSLVLTQNAALAQGGTAMPSAAQIQLLIDKSEITDQVNKVANGADLNDFAMLRTAFADEVNVDYTSIFGGQPNKVKADDLLAGWRGTLPGFQATQHLLGNHTITVSGNTARALVYFVAHHTLPNNAAEADWTLGGYYEYQLAKNAQGWKVTSMKANGLWGEGNMGLIQMATDRVKAGQGRK
jgi:hypothetical protein